MPSENMDDDYEVDQYNAFECEKCDQYTLVTPESTRFILYATTDYALFVGECDNSDCGMTSYRFVPFAKLPHFDFIDWHEFHDKPTKTVQAAWNKYVGENIDSIVADFAIELEHIQPMDF